MEPQGEAAHAVPWPDGWQVDDTSLTQLQAFQKLQCARHRHRALPAIEDLFDDADGFAALCGTSDVEEEEEAKVGPVGPRTADFRQAVFQILTFGRAAARTPYTLASMRTVQRMRADRPATAGAYPTFTIEHLLPRALWRNTGDGLRVVRDLHNLRFARSLANSYRGYLSFGSNSVDADTASFLMVDSKAFLRAGRGIPNMHTLKQRVWNRQTVVTVAESEWEATRRAATARSAAVEGQLVRPRREGSEWGTCRAGTTCASSDKSAWLPPPAMRGDIARSVLHLVLLYVHGDTRFDVERMRAFLRFLPLWRQWDRDMDVTEGEWQTAVCLYNFTGYINPFVVWRLGAATHFLRAPGQPVSLSALLFAPPDATAPPRLSASSREALQLAMAAPARSIAKLFQQRQKVLARQAKQLAAAAAEAAAATPQRSKRRPRRKRRRRKAASTVAEQPAVEEEAREQAHATARGEKVVQHLHRDVPSRFDLDAHLDTSSQSWVSFINNGFGLFGW